MRHCLWFSMLLLPLLGWAQTTPTTLMETTGQHANTEMREQAAATLQLRQRPPAHYPTAAKRAGTVGLVVVEGHVNRLGKVSTTRVVASSGSDVLDAAALQQAQRFVFAPMPALAKDQTVLFQQPFDFRLSP